MTFFTQSLPKGTAVLVSQYNRYGKLMKPAIIGIFDERQHKQYHEIRAKSLADELNVTAKKRGARE